MPSSREQSPNRPRLVTSRSISLKGWALPSLESRKNPLGQKPPGRVSILLGARDSDTTRRTWARLKKNRDTRLSEWVCGNEGLGVGPGSGPTRRDRPSAESQIPEHPQLSRLRASFKYRDNVDFVLEFARNVLI